MGNGFSVSVGRLGFQFRGLKFQSPGMDWNFISLWPTGISVPGTEISVARNGLGLQLFSQLKAGTESWELKTETGTGHKTEN